MPSYKSKINPVTGQFNLVASVDSVEPEAETVKKKELTWWADLENLKLKCSTRLPDGSVAIASVTLWIEPAAPVLSTAMAEDTSVTLTWTEVEQATGYKIKYGLAHEVYTVTVDAGDVLTKAITGLSNDVNYYFVVMAYNTEFDGEVSNELEATPLAINSVLLLHGDVDPIVDSSIYSNEISNFSTVINTETKKFGDGSLSFNGIDQYLTILTSENFILDGDFTIDCWHNEALSSAHERLLGIGSQADHEGSNVFLGIYANTTFNFGFWNGEGHTEWNFEVPYAQGAWVHYAICRVNNVLYFFCNGILLGTDTCSVTLTSGDSGIIVGARYAEDSGSIVEYFNGYIDEVRIVKGVGRWTSNFTPPVAPYSL